MNNKSLLKDLPKSFYQEEKILMSNNIKTWDSLLSISRSAPLQIKTPLNAAKVPASPHRFNLRELHSSPIKHYSQTWGS